MCYAAGIEGKFTNHSLRASGATALFQSEASEKVIQEFTGHQLKLSDNMRKWPVNRSKLLALFSIMELQQGLYY